MATVIFYEKPGCSSNAKQKFVLAAAGHSIDARNLLTERWTSERLRAFFGTRPVAEWFNRAAPQIKSGMVIPEKFNEANALAIMLEQPLLIRRPLLQVDNRCEAGFDEVLVDQWIGLSHPSRPVTTSSMKDIEACSKPAHLQTCTTKD